MENLFLVPRLGGAAGAGVELALAPSWMARLEYLYTDYGTAASYFPRGAQRFTSDLAVQTLRVGLDYRLGRTGIDPDIFTKGPSALDLGWFACTGRRPSSSNTLRRSAAPYHGRNSLDSNAGRETWDATWLRASSCGRAPSSGSIPRSSKDLGLSNTEGVAGFSSGAAFKVGASVPYPRIQRAFVRQTIDLGGETRKWTPTQISSPVRRPPTGWLSPSASSRSPTCSIPTNMRKIRARIS